MNEPLLRASEVARLLNVKISTVYALCHRGEIPHLRIRQGQRRALVRFDPREIRDFLRERSQKVHGEARHG